MSGGRRPGLDDILGRGVIDVMRSAEEAFLAALHDEARVRFEHVAMLAATLAELRAAAVATFPDIAVDAESFASELARRLGRGAHPAQLAQVRADHVHLAIACATGDTLAIHRFEAEFLDEVDATAGRLRARADQAADLRSHLRKVLFVSEPGRPAAVRDFAGRGDLRSYIRVIATRELVRMLNKVQREVGVTDDAFLDMLSPAPDLALSYLRDRYRADVDAAMRAALAGLGEEPRALLRYSVVDGWTVDRIGALYSIHRTTAARRVAAARETLGTAVRAELAAHLTISVDEVDSIIRLVQSRLDLSLERLLG